MHVYFLGAIEAQSLVSAAKGPQCGHTSIPVLHQLWNVTVWLNN